MRSMSLYQTASKVGFTESPLRYGSLTQHVGPLTIQLRRFLSFLFLSEISVFGKEWAKPS